MEELWARKGIKARTVTLPPDLHNVYYIAQ